MKEISWDEYADMIADPLYGRLSDGWYEACVEISKNFGVEPPSKDECVRRFFWIWQDEEWVDWMPDNVANFLKLDVYCDGYSS